MNQARVEKWGRGRNWDQTEHIERINETQHDGYRLLARKEADRVTLWSRHGTDFTD